MSRNKSSDLGEYVKKAQQGDADAFGHLYDQLVKPIYRYIYYKTDRDTAEDLTEETFLRVWQNIKKYKAGKVPFSSWVFRIAHNLVIDHYRQYAPEAEMHENIPDPQSHSDPTRKIEVRLTKVRLHKVIRKLPDNYQEVIILKYMNDMSNREIAVTIGKTEGAVRTLQTRALQKLRTMLDKTVDY